VVLTFKRSSLSCRLRTTRTVCAPLVDGPRGGFQPAVCRVLREFECVFRLIHFFGGFLLHEVREQSVLECQTVRDGADGLRTHRKQSIVEGVVLEVQGLFSDSLSQPRGQSAEATRTVRQVLADGSPGAVLSC
jgi:hypothetical protein